MVDIGFGTLLTQKWGAVGMLVFFVASFGGIRGGA